MVLAQKPKIRTPADKVRELLRQLEAQVGKLEHSTQEEVLDIPLLFDETDRLLEALSESGADVQAERLRFESVAAQFRRKGATFLKKIGGPAQLRAARAPHDPEREQWWWYIDELRAEEQRGQRRRLLRGALIGAAVLTVLAVLYTLFLAPDPATREKFRHQQDAEQLAQQGQYAEALASVEQGLTYAPDDLELTVLKGVLEDLLGRTEQAAATFTRARELAEDRTDFLLTRSQTYHRAGALDKAMADVDEVLAQDPDSAYGHFYKGLIYEARGDLFEANDQYEIAAAKAQEADIAELEGLARVRIAQLMMRMMSPNLPGATPTP
jgi:tetratricopeptide (TPR) repeat protein